MNLIVGLNKYGGYTIQKSIITSYSKHCLFSSEIRVWVASIHEFFNAIMVMLKSFS
jgi:hypothetical protein